MKKPIVLIALLLSIFFIGSTFADEENKNCDHMLKWLVDGNDKLFTVVSTYALDQIAILCLERPADPEVSHPDPQPKKEYPNNERLRI